MLRTTRQPLTRALLAQVAKPPPILQQQRTIVETSRDGTTAEQRRLELELSRYQYIPSALNKIKAEERVVIATRGKEERLEETVENLRRQLKQRDTENEQQGRELSRYLSNFREKLKVNDGTIATLRKEVERQRSNQVTPESSRLEDMHETAIGAIIELKRRDTQATLASASEQRLVQRNAIEDYIAGRKGANELDEALRWATYRESKQLISHYRHRISRLKRRQIRGRSAGWREEAEAKEQQEKEGEVSTLSLVAFAFSTATFIIALGRCLR